MSRNLLKAYVELARLTARNEPARDAYLSLQAIREQTLDDLRLDDSEWIAAANLISTLMSQASIRSTGA